MMNSKDILTKRIQKNIKEKNWAKLTEAMPVTKEYPVAKQLQFRGWFLVGNYYEEQENLIEAIKAYNKARVIKPSVVTVFDKLVEVIEKFFTNNRVEFSKSDLLKIMETLTILINFHAIKFPGHTIPIEKGNKLLNRINYTYKFNAADLIETKVTFQVHEINNSITSDMSIEEVKTEAARVLTTIIREEISKRSSKKGKDAKNHPPDKSKKP